MPTEYKASNGEITALERWGWIAIYKDGTYLKQFDEATGLFHNFAEIEQEKLDVFAMQSMEHPGDPAKRFEIHVAEGMKIIHFYRRQWLDKGTPDERKICFYLFGYEENVNGKAVKTIFEIHPNDAVAIKNTDGREKLEANQNGL